MEKEQMSIMDRWKADAEMYEELAEKENKNTSNLDDASTLDNSDFEDDTLKVNNNDINV